MIFIEFMFIFYHRMEEIFLLLYIIPLLFILDIFIFKKILSQDNYEL
jgi:hypothetical protein